MSEPEKKQNIYKKHFPVFTIITITLNNHSGLLKTYNSIEKQTFTDFEWIVIDGGSTDETLDFLRSKRADTRTAQNPMKFISENDDGIYDAMNTGISMANGRYIIFLNAGDELASDKVLETLAPFTKNKPDFIYGDSLEYMQTPKKQNKLTLKPARKYKDIAWGMFTHHQAMLYSRHKIRDEKLHYSLLYKISGDYDFTVRFLLKAKKINYMPKPICIFEPGGISQQNAMLGRREQYIIREKLEMVPQPKNLWIFIAQTSAWRTKKSFPFLYKLLKLFITHQEKQKVNKQKP